MSQMNLFSRKLLLYFVTAMRKMAFKNISQNKSFILRERDQAVLGMGGRGCRMVNQDQPRLCNKTQPHKTKRKITKRTFIDSTLKRKVTRDWEDGLVDEVPAAQT